MNLAKRSSLTYLYTHTHQVCLLWASGSVIVQFVADDIGYNRPFVFTYIGSGIISCLVPSYLGLSLLGLVQNPPLREGSGSLNTLFCTC